ncbi:MAG: PQQ-like beta-propeller repeat protein [Acidobacteria bacterium]|nr:PQQ-like beta-propeller repeat protein [Acidobacteriota bacterium]
MKKILEMTGLISLLALSMAGCVARATVQTVGDSSTTVSAPPPPPTEAATPATVATPGVPESVGAADSPSGATELKSSVPSVGAVSWPQWRGPNRDGYVGGVSAPRVWPKALKEEWKVPVGVGHASPLVSEGRVYVFARRGETEVLTCLDAVTGKELWQSAPHAVAYEMNPAARDHGKGPKSTPVAAGGKIFTLGISGHLSAHDARTGRLAWRKDFSKQYPSTSPLYGTSMSPVVEKNLLIAHVGGHDRGALTAFDTETGAVRWAYEADGPAYSSPIVVTLAGERQVVTFTQKELVGVSAATGKLLWKLPAKTTYDANSVTPVAYKDTIIFSSEGQGIVAVRPVKQGAGFAAQEVWRNAENELFMNSPVLQGNLLFGMSARKKGQFFCLDADTGKTLWQSPGRAGENAAMLNFAGTLLLLTNDATLFVLPASAKEYAPVAQYTVANSPTWAHPVVVSGTRLLIKDETTLASLAISSN